MHTVALRRKLTNTHVCTVQSIAVAFEYCVMRIARKRLTFPHTDDACSNATAIIDLLRKGLKMDHVSALTFNIRHDTHVFVLTEVR